jgi:hypothetical protein
MQPPYQRVTRTDGSEITTEEVEVIRAEAHQDARDLMDMDTDPDLAVLPQQRFDESDAPD